MANKEAFLKKGEQHGLVIIENDGVLKLNEDAPAEEVNVPRQADFFGLNRMINFAIGFLLFVVVIFVFIKHPAWFWLVWLGVALLAFPYRYWSDWNAKPLRKILFQLEYCWVMNFSLIVVLLSATMGVRMPQWFQNHFFTSLLGLGCGSLMGTNLFPFVAVIFEDLSTMASVFVHLTPCMLAYTFKWHGDEIRAAWPSMFMHDNPESVQSYPTLGGPFFLPTQVLGTVW